MAKIAIRILPNTEHPTRHLYTSRIYHHYATTPSTPKPMFIRTMKYPGRFGIDTRKIKPTPTFMVVVGSVGKKWMTIASILNLREFPKDQEVKGSGGMLRKYHKKNTKDM
jgi:hypothetical protein